MTKKTSKNEFEEKYEPVEELDLQSELSQDSEPVSIDTVTDDLPAVNKKDSKAAKQGPTRKELLKKRFVDLYRIAPNPDNPRKNKSNDELFVSIDEYGMQQPIILRPKDEKEKLPGNGDFAVLDGDCRLEAILTNPPEDTMLTVGDQVIIRDITKEEAFIHTIQANSLRKDFSLEEYCEIIQRLINEKYSYDRIKEILGKSKGFVTERIDFIKNASDEEKKAVFSGEISLREWSRPPVAGDRQEFEEVSLSTRGQDSELSAGGQDPEDFAGFAGEILSSTGQIEEVFSTLTSDDLITKYMDTVEEDDVLGVDQIPEAEALVKVMFETSQGLSRFLDWSTAKIAEQTKDVSQQVEEKVAERLEQKLAEAAAKAQSSSIDLKTFNKRVVDRTTYEFIRKKYKRNDYLYEVNDDKTYTISWVNGESMQDFDDTTEVELAAGVLYLLEKELTLNMSSLVYADYFSEKAREKQIYENRDFSVEDGTTHTWTICFRKFEFKEDFIDYLKEKANNDFDRNMLLLVQIEDVSTYGNKFEELKKLNAALLTVDWSDHILMFYSEEYYRDYLSKIKLQDKYNYEFKLTKAELTTLEKHQPDRLKKVLIDDSQKGKIFLRFKSDKDFKKISEFLTPARNYKFKPLGLPVESLEKEAEEIPVPNVLLSDRFSKFWSNFTQIGEFYKTALETGSMTYNQMQEVFKCSNAIYFERFWDVRDQLTLEKECRKLVDGVEMLYQPCDDCKQLDWFPVGKTTCKKCQTMNKHTALELKIAEADIEKLEGTK